MKIIEVRDGFIKFEADANVFLSSFVEVESAEKKYVCQVIQIKQLSEMRVAYAKILFLYDNGLKDYDKTMPSVDSEVKDFSYDIIAKLIDVEKPIVTGKTADCFSDITLDASAFNKKMLVSVDEKEDDGIIVKNLISEFNKLGKNVIVIDTLGRLDMMKYTAGVDFKLPLNTASLEFMYEECLNDATNESKALIEEIFNSLSEYSKTVPFLPFETLKDIVDDMVNNSHILKLLVLKNKLSKYARMGYFASSSEDVEKLKLILTSRSAVLDLSKLDTVFQNKYLEWIYKTLNQYKNTQILVELSNVVSKKSLKMLLSEENSSITFITHSKFKYLNDIKNVFDNFIIVPSFNNNEVFKVYATFLKAMEKGTYLIVGEGTNYIPLISKLVDFSQKTTEIKEDNSVLEELIEQTEDTEEVQGPIVENNIDAKPVQETTIDETAEDDQYKTVIHPEVVNNMFGDDDNEDLTNIEVEVVTNAATDSETELAEEVVEPEVLPVIDDEIIEAGVPEVSDVIPEENITEEVPVEKSADTEAIEENVLDESIQDDNYEGITIQEVDEYNTENNDNSASLSESDLYENSVEEISVESEDSSDLDMPDETPEIVSDYTETEVIPINEEDNDDFEELQELDLDESSSDDIIIDITDEASEGIKDDVNEEIAREVDKVYTTRKEDDLSDSDLDFIDELNSEDEETVLEEVNEDDSVLEELSQEPDDELQELSDESDENISEPSEILETRDSSTPIVPVYDADIPQEDLVISDPIQQGDSVIHAKYGSGIVEKMIKYGNKTLYSINFDNIGRRLLDPTLTEIKKS